MPQFTYAEVGGTRGELPSGYHHLRESRLIGKGLSTFDAAAERLLSWEMHRRAGLGVAASAPRAAEGVTVLLRLGPLRAPCRVVWVVDEPGRRGFAYGTTAGHPEIGEESFVVEHDPRTDEVHARIVAFSRPGHWLIRLGGPVNRMAQSAITRRYLRALEI